MNPYYIILSDEIHYSPGLTGLEQSWFVSSSILHTPVQCPLPVSLSEGFLQYLARVCELC